MVRSRKLDTTEQERLRALFAYEARLYAQGARIVVGVDEVGRGSLAGPVSAGAVVLGADWHPVPGLDDSKRLTPARREEVATELKECVQHWHVAHVGASVIDERGLMYALRQAFTEAVDGLMLDALPDYVLLDGRPLRLFEHEVALVKGDSCVAAIAAASVLAKVERDALMCAADERYPGYGFAGHKGYGSAAHREAIAKKGLSPFHRRSFCSHFLQEPLF